VPDRSSSSLRRSVLLLALAALAAAITAFRYGLVLALVVGVVSVAIVLLAIGRPEPAEGPANPGRRSFLAAGGLIGLLLATGGAELGRLVRRWTRADPDPVIADMA
jgi:hypothetical protein